MALILMETKIDSHELKLIKMLSKTGPTKQLKKPPIKAA